MAGVVFTFDDGDESVFSVAKEIFGRHGIFPAAFINGYPIENAAGQARAHPEKKKLTVAQLRELQDGCGWDIFSHSWCHYDFTCGDLNRIEFEIDRNLKWLSDNKIGGSEVFAYPSGRIYPPAEKIIKRYHRWARTTEASLENFPFADPLYIKSVALDKSSSRQIGRFLAECRAADKLLIFFGHRVMREERAASRHGLSAARLEKMIQQIHDSSVEITSFRSLLAQAGS